ncbi:MAG TPA: SDR family NAD(P)-dependent oxidoreductase [Miltoncostaeaceae bacterium]|nr:SDR family NAD(P)-dependent oxidoreductase [Miltoncostaeaceae bacterium]
MRPGPRPAAVVTGASSGIGASFARELADRGHDLVLVARRSDRLEILRDELESKTGASVRPVVADLATREGQAAAGEAIDAVADRLRVLVLNAGAGAWGRFAELDPAGERDRVALNVDSVVVLARRGLPALLRSAGGGLVIVSSLAAWQATPFMATYAAAKAFQLRFAEALAEEVRGSGTAVVAVCPGPVATEFHWVAGTESLMRRVPVLQPREVALSGLEALEAARSGVRVLGWRNRASAAAVSLLPRRLVTRISGRIHRPPT